MTREPVDEGVERTGGNGIWFKSEGMEMKNDLDRLILESEIMDKKYVDQSKLQDLLKSCKEVMTGYELLHRARLSRSSEYGIREVDGVVVLGLYNFYETSQGVSHYLGGFSGNRKYMDYGLNASGRRHTEVFMKKLLKDKEVGVVIFLVPPAMFSFDAGKETRAEFNFLLDNPKLAEKVRLVFGAYEMTDRERFNSDLEANSGVVDKNRASRMERSARLVLAEEFEGWINSLKMKK